MKTRIYFHLLADASTNVQFNPNSQHYSLIAACKRVVVACPSLKTFILTYTYEWTVHNMCRLTWATTSWIIVVLTNKVQCWISVTYYDSHHIRWLVFHPLYPSLTNDLHLRISANLHQSFNWLCSPSFRSQRVCVR